MSEPAEASGAAFWGDADETDPLHRYRALVETIEDGIYLLDDDARIAALDDALVEMAGRRREDLLGEHVSALFGDDDAIEGEIERLRSDPGTDGAAIECAVTRPGRAPLPCEVRMSVVGADGAEETVGTVRSIDDPDRAAGPSSEAQAEDERDRPIRRERVIAALEAASEGISVLDADGEFVYVNDAYAETFGYEPAEMLGRHWDDLGIESDPDRFYDDILPNIAEEGQWTGTSTCVRKDGSTFRSQHSLTHTADDELICVVRDVTERKDREREIERYQRIVENLPVGVYRNTPGPDGEFVAANETLASIFDADSVDELLEYNVSDLYTDPDQRAEFSRRLEEEGIVEDVELKQETLDGDTIWISVTAIRTEEDGEVYFDGIVQDVTEQKRVKRRLTEERDMFAQGPAVVFRWAADAADGWPVEYVSENVEDVLGYTPSELESGAIPYADLLLDEEIDRIAGEVEAAVAEGADQFSHDPYRIKTKDGDVRWVKDVTKIVRDDAGDVANYLGYLVDITERKEREEQLEASERRYRALVDHFRNGAVALVDQDMRYRTVGGSPEDVANVATDEIEGRPVREAIPDELADELVPCYEAALEGEASTFETELENGVFDFHVAPVRDDDGEVFAALGMSQDITERIERERDLERTERRFQAIFEDPNILVGLLEPDGTVLDINETAMEYIDADLAAVRGEPIWETPWWGKGDEVQDDVREWTERAANGEYVDFEADLTRPDGERYVLEGFFRPVTNDDGEVVSVIVSDRDVTERREIEERLREHERQLSTLMDNVPGMVYRCRNERGWPMEFVSDACQELTGHDPDALESGDVGWGEDVMIEADREKLWNTVQEEAGDGGTFSETYRIETADGERRWVRDYGRGVFDDDGEMVEIEGIISDVTERKRLEAELDDVFGRVTDGFFALDDNWRFTYVNDHAHDLINPEGRDLEGESIWEQFPAALGRKFEEQYRRAMREQVTVSFEEYYPDPLDTWFEVHAYPSETGLSVYFRDVTDRKERERDLEESERRYRALAEYFPNGIVTLFDHDLEYTLAAGQGFERIPIEPADVEGSRFNEVWDEDTAEALEPLFQGALDGIEQAVELEYAGRDWIVHVVPVTDEGGDVFAGMTMAQDITERKERERELAKYETIVETVNDGIYVKDEDGHFTMVNEAYAEMTGYDREELVGEHASLVVDEETIQQSREVQASGSDDADSALEAPIRTADGDTVPAEGTFSTIETGDGDRNEVGVVRDITERKEQRRKLEESERRYRTLVEHFPNGAVAMFDENLEYTVAGGEILEDVGTSREEIVGQTVWERYPEEIAAQFEPNFRAAVEDGETNEFEIEFHDRHWSVYTLPVKDNDGDVFAGMLMAQDITDRIEREQALQESKNQLQALIELLPVAVFVAEADGEIVEWNEAAEEIWGGEIVESDSVAEYGQYDGWWADTGEPVEPDEWALARALEGEEVTDPDVIEIEGFDGKRRTVLNHGMPVRDADGEVTRAVVTLIDITERNQYQRRLEASNERLEQFAYAASHDLQEPLRMVSSYLQMIERRYADELDEDGREFIEFAVDGADRMREMIEGLLKYSRVDTGGESFERVDLDGVLADVRDDLQVSIEESDAEISAPSLPSVTGDEGQLRQLFQNLLDNAIEYSGEDPPNVEIDAERVGRKWQISVSDEGIGIDADDPDQVFEVFQSLHAPDEYSGTGIGLALCERIVERHGGEIWVDSEPGEGSTFTFTLAAAGEDSD